MRILVTGAEGFIGRHLTAALRAYGGMELYEADRATPREQLEKWCVTCDFVYHLAGVYRPGTQEEYMLVNYGFTETLLKMLARARNNCPVMYASSAQAALSSLYGKSKKAAEELLRQYGRETGSSTYIFRLPFVFGKGAEPHCGCPVAALCEAISRGLPVNNYDPAHSLTLMYIDDLIDALLLLPAGEYTGAGDYCTLPSSYTLTAEQLEETIKSFYALRATSRVPALGDPLTRKLYATYQSYLPAMDFAYPVDMHEDGYGSMSRFLSTPDRGEVIVNVMHAGIDEGEHWHSARTERHLVVAGSGVIRFKRPEDEAFIEYPVSGEKQTVVEIPTGYLHAVTNTGTTDLVDVVWTSACWDPKEPDTYA